MRCSIAVECFAGEDFVSVQFGIYNRDGAPVRDEVLAQIEELLVPYAPDGVSVLRGNSCALLFGSFATVRHVDPPQPYRLRTRDWMMWDGRLDNRNDLIRADQNLTTHSSDLQIVGCSWEIGRSASFPKIAMKFCWPETSSGHALFSIPLMTITSLGQPCSNRYS